MDNTARQRVCNVSYCGSGHQQLSVGHMAALVVVAVFIIIAVCYEPAHPARAVAGARTADCTAHVAK
jgi:hypothetical protein